MLPSILSGPAGRAHEILFDAGTRVGIDRSTARDMINSARGDVAKALGSDRTPGFMSEMHAASLNMRPPGAGPVGDAAGAIDDLLHGGTSASRASALAAYGSGLDELAAVGRSTAIKRLAIGGLATAGAIGGALLLANVLGGDRGDEIAPGPAGGGGGGGSWY